MPAPTGARINHILDDATYKALAGFGAITMVPGTSHEHAYAAALRSLGYAHVISKARPRACYLLAGESNTRLRCLQLQPPVPTPSQFPVHHQIPNIDIRDALRVERAATNVRSGSALGTTCHCELSVCPHFAARYQAVSDAFADDDDWPVPFVLILCDVYAVSPAAVRDFYLDFERFLVQRGHTPQEVYSCMAASVTYRMGHRWHYSGTLFRGEYTYQRMPDGSVHARVEGNGDVDYRDSIGDDWFTTEPAFGGLAWQVDRIMGDLVIHRAVWCREREIKPVAATANTARELARDFARTGLKGRLYLPLADYVYCRRLDGFGDLPVPRALVEHLRSLAMGCVRDNRIRTALYARANLIMEGRFPRCEVDVPPSLRPTIVELAVGEVFNFPAPGEIETRDVELMRTRVRTEYNNQVQLVDPIDHSSRFLAIVAVLLAIIKFSPALYRHVGPVWTLFLTGIRYAMMGLYVMLLLLAGTMWAGSDRTRLRLVQRGIPTGRSHWFMLLLIMFAPLAFGQVQNPTVRLTTDTCLPEYETITPFYAYHQGDFGHLELPPLDDGKREPAGSYAARGLPALADSKPAEVSVDRCECQCNREAIGAWLFGGYSKSCPVTVPAACWCSLYTSVRSRVTRKTIGTSMEAWAQPAKRFLHLVREKVDDLDTFVQATNFEQWLQREGYSTAVRDQLRAARESLGTHALDARDMVSKLFPKVEKFVKQEVPGVLMEYAPRAIQGMTDRLQVTVGPWFHAASKRMGSIFSGHEPILYGPGKTAEDIGSWFAHWHSQFPYILEIDAVKLDLHLKEAALDTQVEIYRGLGCPPKVLSAKIMENLQVRGVSVKGVNFCVRAVKRSGDSDTTFGNTCSCACCWIAALESIGLVLGQDFALAVMGDDVVVLVRVLPNTQALLDFVRSMGIESEMSLHTHVANCTFLSALFYPSQDGIVLAPMIGRVLARLGWATHSQGMERWGANKWGRYMYSVARGLQKTVAHVPVMSVYIDHLLKLGIENEERTKAFEHKVMASQAHALDAAVYEFIEQRYGLGPLAIDQMEEEIRSIRSFPHAWQHPGFQVMIERDCL